MFATPLNKISIMFSGHVIKNKYGHDYHAHLSIASYSLGEGPEYTWIRITGVLVYNANFWVLPGQ